MKKPSRAEHLKRVHQVVGYAQRTISHVGRAPEFWRNEGDPVLRFGDKIIVESSVLLLLLARLGPRINRTALEAAVTQLLPLARAPRVRALLMRFPTSAISLGISTIAISQLGRKDLQLDELIRRTLETGLADGSEKLPFRSMDARWVRSLLDGGQPPNLDDLIAESILAAKTHAIYMTRPDAYSLTHALMYATDFGRKRPSKLIDRRTVGAMIDGAIAWNLFTEDLDLLSELVLAACFLRTPWSPHVRMAFHLIEQAWNEFGFLPSPTFEADTFTKLSPAKARSYAIRHVYHTTYVSGILFAQLAMHPARNASSFRSTLARRDINNLAQECAEVEAGMRRCLSGRKDRANSGSDESTAAVTNTLSADELSRQLVRRLQDVRGGHDVETRYWYRSAQSAPLSKADLAIVISDIALTICARKYALPSLVGALRDISRSRIPYSPTFGESLRFFLRQKLPNGAVGAEYLEATNCGDINRHGHKSLEIMAIDLSELSATLRAISRNASNRTVR